LKFFPGASAGGRSIAIMRTGRIERPRVTRSCLLAHMPFLFHRPRAEVWAEAAFRKFGLEREVDIFLVSARPQPIRVFRADGKAQPRSRGNFESRTQAFWLDANRLVNQSSGITTTNKVPAEVILRIEHREALRLHGFGV
jgi:hypothetical protein